MLLICFDAEPEFIDLIRKGILVGAGIQQPFLMGEKAVDAMHTYLNGGQPPEHMRLPVLVVTRKNIDAELPTIRRNLLGIGEK
jgi:ABC-type sugar transport system substrate-binding protein